MKNESFLRYWFVGGAMLAFGIVILGWVIYVQNSPKASEVMEKSKYYDQSIRFVYPERGNIYDRWGVLLAGNQESYEINADVNKIVNKDTIASTLASVLGSDYAQLMTRMTPANPTGATQYVVLARFVPKEKIEQIKAIQLQYSEQANKRSPSIFNKTDAKMPTLYGLEYTPLLIRTYPEKSLAANILGFYTYQQGVDAKGSYGIEASYDGLLGGKPVIYKQKNDPQQVTKPPIVPPGASLVLTIDRDIQSMTEQVLDNAIIKNGAKGGTIMIMDPKTGEIMAMAVQPRMDLNEYWKIGDVYTEGLPYNRAIGTTYEPGSVFKVLTMAAAFDAKIAQPDTPFTDTGTIVVGGVAIHNWDRGAWGNQTMLGCMQHSLNVCLASMAVKLGPTRFYEYMKNFGIGHITRVDLAGESNYPLNTPGDPFWYEVNLGTNSFGQGVAVTPIQMITAINSIANHGNMMAPRLLHSVIQDGEEQPYLPQVIGRPISAEAADSLSKMLQESLAKESSLALVPGYSVAGKTGTAEIPTPKGYTSDVTNTSFVGWGPVDDPRFIVYVWLEKPTSSIWGSEVASPVFKEVVQKLVVLLNLPPDTTRQEMAQSH
jgi:cell division protein FtsI/penicillin-binding protein 2